MKQGYSMSETSLTLFTKRWCDWDKNSGSTGWLIPNVQANVCSGQVDVPNDEPVVELDYGSVGGLYIKEPDVFEGYLAYIEAGCDLFIMNKAKKLINMKAVKLHHQSWKADFSRTSLFKTLLLSESTSQNWV